MISNSLCIEFHTPYKIEETNISFMSKFSVYNVPYTECTPDYSRTWTVNTMSQTNLFTEKRPLTCYPLGYLKDNNIEVFVSGLVISETVLSNFWNGIVINGDILILFLSVNLLYCFDIGYELLDLLYIYLMLNGTIYVLYRWFT